jgi:DNA-binding FadR family transcriptional regulator
MATTTTIAAAALSGWIAVRSACSAAAVDELAVVTFKSYNHGMNLDQLPPRPARAEAVIDRLRAQITSGAWPVGSRIPTEPELVARLGVARNTVREAVRALAHNGLLDIRQGSGTYVRATSELAAVMQRRFAGADTRHVAELRSSLESTAAALAAIRRTADDMSQIDVALERREDAWRSRDAPGFVDTDTAFHLSVVAASHNPVLAGLYADLVEVVRDFLRADVGPELQPESYVDHGRLVEAIRAGDAEQAAAEAGGHAFVWEQSWPTRPPR